MKNNNNNKSSDLRLSEAFEKSNTYKAVDFNLLNENKEKLQIIPIGGIGRIGMNWTLYGYKDEWILVDAGLAFGGKKYPDTEAFFPDPKVFEPIKNKIKGLIVTHAHEDHIGAIHRLVGRMDLPIYATPYASRIIKKRLRKVTKDFVVNTFVPEDTIKFDNIEIDTILMTHSTPEPVALFIKTEQGNILHTGDWKVDKNPIVGKPANFDRLFNLKNITAILSDSTSVFSDKGHTSEEDVYKGFEKIIERTNTGKVIVSAFSSNIARIKSLSLISKKLNKRFAIAGSSLLSNMISAKQANLLNDIDYVVKASDELEYIKYYPENYVIMATGSQGEENGALNKMLGNYEKFPSIEENDIVIFSSRQIPGNEEEIQAVKEKIMDKGAIVIDFNNNDEIIHVSGHASRKDIEYLYSNIQENVKYCIPVHGEKEHLEENARLAEKYNMEPLLVFEEGYAIEVENNNIKIIGKLNVPLLATPKNYYSETTFEWSEDIGFLDNLEEENTIKIAI